MHAEKVATWHSTYDSVLGYYSTLSGLNAPLEIKEGFYASGVQGLPAGVSGVSPDLPFSLWPPAAANKKRKRSIAGTPRTPAKGGCPLQSRSKIVKLTPKGGHSAPRQGATAPWNPVRQRPSQRSCQYKPPHGSRASGKERSSAGFQCGTRCIYIVDYDYSTSIKHAGCKCWGAEKGSCNILVTFVGFQVHLRQCCSLSYQQVVI